VLFENLEMERTVRAGGGRVRALHDLYVARRPPSTRHFLGQRVRQAYDSLAQPGRLAAELAILPTVLIADGGRRYWLRLRARRSSSERSGGDAVAVRACSRPPRRCGRRRGCWNAA